MKKRIVFQYVLRGLLSIICKNMLRVEQDHAPCITDPIFFYPSFKNRQVYRDEKEQCTGLNMNNVRYIDCKKK